MNVWPLRVLSHGVMTGGADVAMTPPAEDPGYWAGTTLIVVETGVGWVEVGSERVRVKAPSVVEIEQGANWRFGHDETEAECAYRLYVTHRPGTYRLIHSTMGHGGGGSRPPGG